MIINEVLKIETSNSNKIYLHKEGMFWRAYEVSALLFHKYIKKFTILKKYVKKVSNNIIFLGFPHASLDSILNIAKNNNIIIESSTNVLIVFDNLPEIQNFEDLKLQVSPPPIKQNHNLNTDASNIVFQKIKNFPVSSKTPIEALCFVAELQEDLKALNKTKTEK